MAANNFNISGLNEQEVIAARLKWGGNRLLLKKSNYLLDILKELAAEPMILLLLISAGVYLLNGKRNDALFLLIAVMLVAGISLFQSSRSQKALDKLKALTQPLCKVIRAGEVINVKSEDLVVGDSLLIEEGTGITADARIVYSNDFSVNESVLTGESMPVFKDSLSANNLVFQGTVVAGGLAVATVTAVGNHTRLGKIGKSMESIAVEKTPLERQINNFVKKMVVAGSIIFVIVWAINYSRSYNWLTSLGSALTLAMSILPEEIPVAFTTFMALGAWRLMKLGVVVKQIKTVETLGSASVICVDKTGTITENTMSLAKLYAFGPARFYDADGQLDEPAKALLRLAMWASEPAPFDMMEVALHKAYANTCLTDERPDYHMIHEYPLSGKPPMMTHVFKKADGTVIIAAKGAPEAMMAVSGLSDEQQSVVEGAIKKLSMDGYRILGVAESHFKGTNFPARQQELSFVFKGLVAFYDPPKKNIAAVLKDFYRAGITVKILTGDNALTTQAIAGEINFHGTGHSISGDQILSMPQNKLREIVKHTNIFSRMFPEAKLKIINALKEDNEIVAMTGDGVNDGPALKAAHIGIAMGRKGTELAKEAASLILLEDDLHTMVDAIAMGRRIYANLKKAIQYIISIHIPIILTVFVPLALGWRYPNIFSPVHIIFLELIMGPTCSIIYENEPMEKNTMLQLPRPISTTFFNWRELLTSVVQGLIIAAGTLLIYRYALYQGYNEQLTRTMVFICLLAANISLTMVNRSFYYSVITTLKYKNTLIPIIIIITMAIAATLLYIKPLTTFFEFVQPGLSQLAVSIGIGFLSVIWFEVVKWKKRRRYIISK